MVLGGKIPFGAYKYKHAMDKARVLIRSVQVFKGELGPNEVRSLTSALAIARGPDRYRVDRNTHCGGEDIESLEEGKIKYGWKPGTSGVEGCKSKCCASTVCTAFVWRASDSKCFWKSGSSSATLKTRTGAHCYTKRLANTCANF